MGHSSDEAPRTLGFCTVRSHADHGYFGGYLILNTHARPLEFHCTLPVKPSRAQEILYGATLADFVCGEQIAKALTSKAKLTPHVVLTDCTPVLALSRVSDLLVACVPGQQASNLPTSDATRTKTIKLGDHSLEICAMICKQNRNCASSGNNWMSPSISPNHSSASPKRSSKPTPS